MAVVAALAAALCGCGPAVRIFRGTTTTTTTTTGTGAATTTVTTQGAMTYVYAGSDPNEYVFSVGAGGASQAWGATANGTALTFPGGQFVTTTVGSTTTNTTLTGGTGSIDQAQLTLNLQGTTAATGGTATGNGTFTISFAGTKE